MEFIKRMKKREFIEMGLKTLAALMLAFIAIILMEGMIYSITLHAYKENSSVVTISSTSTVYCIKDSKNDDGEQLYTLLAYNKGATKNGATSDWCSSKTKYTKAKIIEEYENNVKADVVWHAPNAFEFTITPIHYVVITIFVLAVGGFFTYKFIKLSKSYKEVEATYEKTGAIEITNK